MELRNHPLLTYRGMRTWPPVWTLIHGARDERPRGEIGVLKEIHISLAPLDNQDKPSTYNRIFLFIEHADDSYIGCLMMEDYAFCEALAKLLRDQCGRSLAEIGTLDVGHTL